jgi:DNA-binding NarL/FixJ family response regulator
VSAAEDLAVDFSPRPELERVLRRCTELLGCDAGSICSVDEAAGTYRKEADIGVACQSGQVFPLSEGMTGTVVARRGPVWFDRYDQVPGGHVADPERATLRGVIGVPLEWRGRVIGACIVFSRDERRVFGPGDAELLELFARHEAIVLATARLREAAEVTARVEAVAAELSRAARRLRTASREALDALAEARLTLLGLASATNEAPPPAGLPGVGLTRDGLPGGDPSRNGLPGDGRPAGGSPKLRVLIAADRPLLRAGIARLLSGAGAALDAGLAGSVSEPRIEIVGEAASADAAVAACRELRPDVVLADLGLTAGAGTAAPTVTSTSSSSTPSFSTGATSDGTARVPDDPAGVTELLLGELPDLAVVGLCEAGDERLVAEAMRVGARGCVDTWADGRELARAIIAAGRGQAILSAPALAQLQRGLRGDAGEPALTARERQVRGLMEQGLPDKVIAERLVLSVKTVEKHAGAVLRKTGARNRAELAALAGRARPRPVR